MSPARDWDLPCVSDLYDVWFRRLAVLVDASRSAAGLVPSFATRSPFLQLISSFCNSLPRPCCRSKVFTNVVSYSMAVPSFIDPWGFNLALSEGVSVPDAAELDRRAAERIEGELEYLDGEFMVAMQVLPKCVRKHLAEEMHVYTQDTPRYLSSGKGINAA